MRSFIDEVVEKVLEKHNSIEGFVFVLPSKRAGTFLRNSIAQKINRTIFAPKIYSIEELIENISGLTYASNSLLLFELYHVYLKNVSGEKDSFYDFSKWGQTLLQDFNEIDRHLVDTKEIFGNLAAIQEINHWSLQAEKTKMMKEYLHFWKSAEKVYHEFTANLIQKGIAYQGLVYRHACDRLKIYKEKFTAHHIFIGFNALNRAESQIVQSMLGSLRAEIFWDIDNSFLDDPIHAAGYFIRKYRKTWPYFENNELQGLSNHFGEPKKIQIIGVPKSISQAKYLGHLVKDIGRKHPDTLLNTALVLGDESLLNPILNAIPKEIEEVNITMGYPLQGTIIAAMFNKFFDLYLKPHPNGWHHKDVTSFLNHPFIGILLKGTSQKILNEIRTKNITFLTLEKLRAISKNDPGITLIFSDGLVTAEVFLRKCLDLIQALRFKIEGQTDTLALEYLYRFHTLFNELLNLIYAYGFVNDMKSLHSLFKELLSSETLDFQGDPLKGLQIMGMLESRNLDFETVILTSVNEGILPSGKSNNSFIPFDLKTYFGMPTYKEKDAIYTYHFYRLLQRAKNIYILYNTEPDTLEGGEKSRLITQLLTDGQNADDIELTIASPETTVITKEPEIITKGPDLLHLIRDHTARGFSPSSLSNYIRNPIDFYKQSLLGIEDRLEVEETVANNTFGTIVHDTLENLYEPLLGKYLTPKDLTALKPNIEKLVAHHFTKSYGNEDITQGKNLIAYHVIVKYLQKFIALEIEEAQKHKIKILGLEKKMKIEVKLPKIDFPIYLKGKIDRIDEKDGILRIIDYKTGKVEPKNVTISNWDDIRLNYDYSKAFQLLCYALMYQEMQRTPELEAGIITFKNLNGGLQKFTLKEMNGANGKNQLVDQEVLRLFKDQLEQLILEICDIDTPFIEKEV
ncbi:PD-(D/E)XK nuclease family protein [Maribacter algicola]|uniref:PD-(D/E)XK nuclease family protein n=1 Tax=Meishania litoralis TaxID=3434685 RepID=A0ACC7LJI9_9FLAO